MHTDRKGSIETKMWRVACTRVAQARRRRVPRWLWWVSGTSGVLLVLYGFLTGFLIHPVYWTLINAIEDSDAPRVQWLLEHGVDPNFVPSDFWTAGWLEADYSPMCCAARNDDLKVMRVLLDHKGDPNLGDGWDGSPLEVAAQDEHLEMMQLLIDHGAKVNDDADGSYTLWRAAVDGKTKSVAFLLAHGANPNSLVEGSTKKVRLLSALLATPHSQEVVRLLKAAGAKE